LRPAVFVDRDGVINTLVPDPATGLPESPLAVDQVRLLPGAGAALRRLHEAGFLVVGVSNQPAAAKGKVTLAELEGVQARVLGLLAEEGFVPEAFELCFHHPDGVVPELSGPCDCRKPAPGMLLAAAERLKIDLDHSWLIGDTDTDVEAGAAAGVHTVLVATPGSAHKRGSSTPDEVVADLAAAVERVLRSHPTATSGATG
jgi:D-glycero-D-manno-heptose 1,7-bisphosphate phosphatase